MSRDYARTGTRTRSKRKPPQHRSGIPGWVWLFTGTVAGAFIMFLVYLSGMAPTPNKSSSSSGISSTLSGLFNSDTAKPASNKANDIKQDLKSLQKLEKPIFEFYDTLMNSEVIHSGNSQIGSETNSQQKNDSQSPPATYMLQAASFSKKTDAETLKVQLILSGLDVSLAEFNNRGDLYHRVMIGPFDDTKKMSSAKKILATHNLSPIVLQKKAR